MNVRHIINYSFANATKAMVMGTSPQALHSARERVWVKSLAAQLAEEYNEEMIRVFSRSNRDNQTDFGLDKFLYDIQVCRIAKTKTVDKLKRELLYVQSSLWQVECDFSRDVDSALHTLNKLVVGNSENKLFVGAHIPSADSYIGTLKAPAAACNGALYLALIPHPENWDDLEQEIDVWQFTDGNWKTVK